MVDVALAHNALFLVLPPDEIAQVRKLLDERSYRKGEWIFREGEPATIAWIILEGWVHLVRASSHRREVTIFTMTPSDALCGLSALEEGTYTTGAVAATACRLAGLPGKYVAALVERYPVFAREVLALERLRIRHMAEAICRAHDPVESRLADTLLRLSEQFGATIPVTHRELAQMAHTTLETSIRVAGRLRSDGLVATRRGHITIRDRERLRGVATLGNGHSTARHTS